MLDSEVSVAPGWGGYELSELEDLAYIFEALYLALRPRLIETCLMKKKE